MSAREDLMRAAKECLVELGWGSTTVRDIAGRAGVNHASIGYHYGSREALLSQALVESVDDLDRTLADAGDDPRARWSALAGTFGTHRELWVAQLEAVLQAQRSPVVRDRLVEGQRQAREGMGGSVPLALLIGLAVQFLVDGEVGESTLGDARDLLKVK